MQTFWQHVSSMSKKKSMPRVIYLLFFLVRPWFFCRFFFFSMSIFLKTCYGMSKISLKLTLHAITDFYINFIFILLNIKKRKCLYRKILYLSFFQKKCRIFSFFFLSNWHLSHLYICHNHIILSYSAIYRQYLSESVLFLYITETWGGGGGGGFVKK